MIRIADAPSRSKPGRFDITLGIVTAIRRALKHVRTESLKEKRQEQTKFGAGDVWKMMTVPGEGAERLAEIFREIFALSETNKPNHSKSATVDGSIKSFGAQGKLRGKRKQTSKEHSDAEDQKPCR